MRAVGGEGEEKGEGAEEEDARELHIRSFGRVRVGFEGLG